MAGKHTHGGVARLSASESKSLPDKAQCGQSQIAWGSQGTIGQKVAAAFIIQLLVVIVCHRRVAADGLTMEPLFN